MKKSCSEELAETCYVGTRIFIVFVLFLTPAATFNPIVAQLALLIVCLAVMTAFLGLGLKKEHLIAYRLLKLLCGAFLLGPFLAVITAIAVPADHSLGLIGITLPAFAFGIGLLFRLRQNDCDDCHRLRH